MKSIRLLNYKCFEDTGILELKPLTFLLGSNSSGKSSFLEFFALLQQSMFTNRDGSLLWVGNNVDLNDFHTVVRNGQGNITFEVEIEKIPLDTVTLGQNASYLNNVSVGVEIAKTDFSDAITMFYIKFNKQEIIVHLKEKETDVVYVNNELISYQSETIMHSSTNSLLPKLIFQEEYYENYSKKCRLSLMNWLNHNFKETEEGKFLSPSIVFRLKKIKDRASFNSLVNKSIKKEIATDELDHIFNLALFYNINDIIDLVNYYMLELSKKMEFIQPLRASAERYYRNRNISVNTITPSGDNVAMFFLRLKREKQLAKFNEWLQTNDMQFEVDLNEEGGFVELIIIENGKESKNIIDVGFGYSQILPILATIWKDLYYHTTSTRVPYCSSSYVLIEQPELHLHPRFQRKFADLLTRCVKQIVDNKEDIRFIIETHSQEILNTVGLSVAYGQFDSSLVNIYIFNAQYENMKNYIEKAKYTKEGFLENWPIGFFD